MSNEQATVDALAQAHGFDADAVRAMLQAVRAGGGTMAQFNHPALGGMGQWSSGGMTMIGDMFNNGLKDRVAKLAGDVSQHLRDGSLPGGAPSVGGHAASSGDWWPSALGRPASSGSQNSMRYAIFPDAQRLVVEQDGKQRVYDTGNHHIGGVSQQQGGSQSLQFSSQNGAVRLADLAEVAAP